jgi:hypothetical protein
MSDVVAGTRCPNAEPWYIRCKGPIVVFALVIALIFLQWFYLKSTVPPEQIVYADPMNEKVIDVPFLENCCSWWPISHFILFLVLGYFFPDCWVYLVIAGITWELLEMVMSHLTGHQRQAVKVSDARVEYSGNWWAGSFKDVFMDVAGLIVGILLRKLVEAALGESRDACGRPTGPRGPLAA